jgi:hypothetical protein
MAPVLKQVQIGGFSRAYECGRSTNHHRQLEEFLSTGLHLQTVNLWVIPQVHSRQQYQSLLNMNAADRASSIKSGASFSNAGDFIAANPKTAAGAALSVAAGMQKDPAKPAEPDKDMGQRYSYSPGTTNPIPAPDVPTYEDMLTKPGNYGRQQKYFSPAYTPISNTAAKDLYNYAAGGPVETMSNQAAMGANTMYPMANMATSSFATPYQSPVSTNMLAPTSDAV